MPASEAILRRMAITIVNGPKRASAMSIAMTPSPHPCPMVSGLAVSPHHVEESADRSTRRGGPRTGRRVGSNQGTENRSSPGGRLFCSAKQPVPAECSRIYALTAKKWAAALRADPHDADHVRVGRPGRHALAGAGMQGLWQGQHRLY